MTGLQQTKCRLSTVRISTDDPCAKKSARSGKADQEYALLGELVQRVRASELPTVVVQFYLREEIRERAEEMAMAPDAVTTPEENFSL